jgi:hypothetical protein
MARVKIVQNSRKDHQCGAGHVIPKGEAYYTASPGFRARPRYRCMAHPFRPSMLTTSARSEPLSAVEAFEDQVNAGFDSIEDLQSAWDDLGSALEEYVQMRDEGLEAWENGNSQLEELRDQAQDAYDTWEQHDIEEFDEDEPQREDFKDSPKGQDKYDDAYAQWEEARQEFIAEQATEALDVAGSLDF